MAELMFQDREHFQANRYADFVNRGIIVEVESPDGRVAYPDCPPM